MFYLNIRVLFILIKRIQIIEVYAIPNVEPSYLTGLIRNCSYGTNSAYFNTLVVKLVLCLEHIINAKIHDYFEDIFTNNDIESADEDNPSVFLHIAVNILYVLLLYHFIDIHSYHNSPLM